MRISDFVMGRGDTPYVEIVPRLDNANPRALFCHRLVTPDTILRWHRRLVRRR